MKKFLLIIFMSMVALNFAFAEQVEIKGGTVVSLEATNSVRGAKAHVGQTVDFRVLRDVKVNGIVAIPMGSIAKGTVYEAKRSTCFGTKGRLGIKVRYVTLPSGDVVNFASSDIYITGKNRTPVSVVVFIFTLLPFPCGSKAEMPIGYEFDATVASNTTVNI